MSKSLLLWCKALSCGPSPNSTTERFGISGSQFGVLKRLGRLRLTLGRSFLLTLAQGRGDFIKSLEKDLYEGIPHSKSDDDYLSKKFIDMHELYRHAIHMAETLQVGAGTIASILNSSRLWHTNHSQPVLDVIDKLQFASSFLSNLKLRADSFADRIRNETSFVRDQLAFLDFETKSNVGPGI
jgi:hypothetical protein